MLKLLSQWEFNHWPLVWHDCSLKNTQKMEILQERGLRIVFCDYVSTPNELLHKVGKDVLYVSRIK